MTRDEALEKVLHAYTAYYNITRDALPAEFAAEAVFDLHDERYVLVKRARIAEEYSKEFVYFAVPAHVTTGILSALADKAWETGLKKVHPQPNHRNSDVTLFVITDRLDPDAAALARKLRRSKSYLFSLRGWSSFRLIVCDLSSGTCAHNRLGADLRKTAGNILQLKK